MDDIHDIAEFYNNTLEKESARLDRHQLEYELTLRVLDQYLPKSGSILEIGAATGRYTQVLAQKGYRVTAVDLSTELLKKCQRNIENAGLGEQVQYIVADVRNLSDISAKDYDAVLLMGPLYHLVEEEDRKLALQQVYEHLHASGILLSAFISRYGILGDLMKNIPEWIEDEAEVRSVIEEGKDPDDYPRGGFRGYFAKTSDITPLHEEIGFETLALIGVEPAISADDESYNKLEGKQRQLWLDLLYEVSTEPSIIGASRHLLYVGKKLNEKSPKELVQEGYDKVSQAYRADALDPSDETYIKYKGWVDELATHLPKDAKVLDMGCGNGIPSTQLLAETYQVTAVDISPVQIERAKGLVPSAEFICADMSTVTFKAASFDAILSFYAIIHLPLEEQPPLFAKMHNWLKDDGYLLLVVGHDAWTGQTADWLGVQDGDMFWSHTDRETYLQWIAEAGFQHVWDRFIPEGEGGHTLIFAQKTH